MAEKKNLLPKLASWMISTTQVSDTIIVSEDGYSATWIAVSESDYLRCRPVVDSIKGHTLKLTCDDFSSTDGLAWLYIRLYDAAVETYTEIGWHQEDGEILLPFEAEFAVPADCGRLEIRLRHQHDSDGYPEATFTVTNICLVDTYTESLTALNFHKVLEENLPATVTPGTQHIYYTTDGTTVKQYIATAQGYLVPVGGVASGSGSETTEYTNAYTQQHIDERKEEIKALARAGHTIVFAVATDIHIRIEDGDAGRYNQVRDFIMLSNQLPLDYIVCEGDIMSYAQLWDGAYEPRIEKVKDIFKQARCPWWATRGNHDYNDDDNSWQNNPNIQEFTPDNADELFISNLDWHRSITSQMFDGIGYDVVFDEDHHSYGYFYVDDYAHKHRLIFCNSEETQEDEYGNPYINAAGVVDAYISGVETIHQVRWVTDKAMDMTGKEDWVVSFHSHTVPYTDAAEDDKSEFHGYGGDNPELRQIIKAFQEGAAVKLKYGCVDVVNHTWTEIDIDKDFSSQGAIAVLGWFGGHCHDDCYRKVDGLNVNISTCTCASRRDGWTLDPMPTKLPPERNTGELAMSVNVFIVNKDTRTIDMIKVGSKRDNTVKTSSDLHFTY